jgi:hypothetical protein
VRKKVKSFTVDEEVYASLAGVLKETNPEGSLSLFVHNCMKEFLDYINGIKEELKFRNYSVPLTYVIDEIIKNPLLMGRTESEEFEDPKSPYGTHYISKYEIDAEEWNDKYEAEKRKISIELYSFLKTDLYELSANKKYLIHKETGKKYIPVDRNRLVELVKADSD